MVVGLRRPEVVDAGGHEVDRLEAGGAVEDDQLVEAAVRGSLGRGAVVADDHVDERVVEQLELVERVDHAADVVVGVLHEARVDLHLAGEDRLHLVRRLVPGGDLLRPRGQLCVLRDDAELLLARERLLAELVPALVELALVLGRPLGRDMVRGVRRARRVVDEERLVRHQRLLLADPVDRVVGHVLGEVVALIRRPVRLDRHGAVVERRRVLVRLAAEEAVEVLEAAAPGRPRVEGPHRARLPDGHLVALAELRGRVAVQLQRLGQRRRRLRPDRVVSGRGGGDLRDPAHADGVVIATGEQGLPRRRAERRRVEAVVPEPVRREPLEIRRLARPAEGARRPEAGVVEQHDQHVRRAFRRPQRLDRREARVRALGVVGRDADKVRVGNRQDAALWLGLRHSGSSRGTETWSGASLGPSSEPVIAPSVRSSAVKRCRPSPAAH